MTDAGGSLLLLFLFCSEEVWNQPSSTSLHAETLRRHIFFDDRRARKTLSLLSSGRRRDRGFRLSVPTRRRAFNRHRPLMSRCEPCQAESAAASLLAYLQ